MYLPGACSARPRAQAVLACQGRRVGAARAGRDRVSLQGMQYRQSSGAVSGARHRLSESGCGGVAACRPGEGRDPDPLAFMVAPSAETTRHAVMVWTATYGIALCQNEVVANLRQGSRP